MRWRDIRFEQPTKSSGQLLCQGHAEELWLAEWDDGFSFDEIKCWMPSRELPKPDLPGEIPEGWRPVDKAVDRRPDFQSAKRWERRIDAWEDIEISFASGWDPTGYYIVPIDQPKPTKPKYRPFANAAEFAPHRDRWWRYKADSFAKQRPPSQFSDDEHAADSWSLSFQEKEFADDRTPFGVRAEE